MVFILELKLGLVINMNILRIENSEGFGFETCFSEKRRNVLSSLGDARHGFGFYPKVLSYKYYDFNRNIALTKIQHIQLYIGLCTRFEFHPLYNLALKIVKVDKNNCIKSINFLSDKKFVSELKNLGFELNSYQSNKIIRKFRNDITFVPGIKSSYKPKRNKSFKIKWIHDNSRWNIDKNCFLNKENFI